MVLGVRPRDGVSSRQLLGFYSLVRCVRVHVLVGCVFVIALVFCAAHFHIQPRTVAQPHISSLLIMHIQL